MDAKFALMSLVSGIGSTILLVALLARRFEGRDGVASTSVVSALLWVAIAFAQNVALTWLASLAYAAYAVSMVSRVAFRVPRLRGHAGSIRGVVVSVMDVVCVTSMLDLAILVILALVEKVIPYYVSLV